MLSLFQVIMTAGQQWMQASSDPLLAPEPFDDCLKHIYSCEISPPLQEWILGGHSPGVLVADLDEMQKSPVFDIKSSASVMRPKATNVFCGWVCHSVISGCNLSWSWNILCLIVWLHYQLGSSILVNSVSMFDQHHCQFIIIIIFSNYLKRHSSFIQLSAWRFLELSAQEPKKSPTRFQLHQGCQRHHRRNVLAVPQVSHFCAAKIHVLRDGHLDAENNSKY